MLKSFRKISILILSSVVFLVTLACNASFTSFQSHCHIYSTNAILRSTRGNGGSAQSAGDIGLCAVQRNGSGFQFPKIHDRFTDTTIDWQ